MDVLLECESVGHDFPLSATSREKFSDRDFEIVTDYTEALPNEGSHESRAVGDSNHISSIGGTLPLVQYGSRINGKCRKSCERSPGSD